MDDEAYMTVLDPMHRLRTALESPMRPAPHRLTLVSAKDGSCMQHVVAWLGLVLPEITCKLGQPT